MNDLTISMQNADIIRKLSVGGGFIPNILLMQGTSPQLATVPNLKQGDFLLGQENNLGNVFECTVCNYRPHAILINKRVKELESFNVSSAIFKQIVATPSTKGNPNGLVSMYGIDWLLWVPKAGQFGVMFLGKSSSRPVSRELTVYITKPEERKVGFSDGERQQPHTTSFKFNSFRFAYPGGKLPHMRPAIEPLDYNYFKVEQLPERSVFDETLTQFLAVTDSIENITADTNTEDIIR